MQRPDSRPLDNEGYQGPRVTFGIDTDQAAGSSWDSNNQQRGTTHDINSPSFNAAYNNGSAFREGGDFTMPSSKTQKFIEKVKEEFSTGFIVPKIFYFFFFCAFGSFFPLMAIYFKNLGFTAGQAGILIGVRPFVEFCSTPVWAKIIDKIGRLKWILMFSLLSLIGFTLTLSQVRPKHSGCLAWNLTHYWLLDPVFVDTDDKDTNVFPHTDAVPPHDLVQHLPPDHVVGFSPMMLRQYNVINYEDKDENANLWIKPPFSAAVYRNDNIQSTFWMLLLVVILSEFFAAPAIPLADAATIASLPPGEVNRHARQRMFGSFGWGLAMFCVGFVLDHSAMIGSHPCNTKDAHERNYTYCFAAFTTFMAIATITATRFRLHNLPKQFIAPGVLRQVFGFPAMNTQPMDTKYTYPQSSANLADEYQDDGMLDAPIINAGAENDLEEADNNPMRSDFASLLLVLKTYGSAKFYVILFIGWFFGFGTALNFSFQFWHLQDLGGKASVFGIASIINHTCEILSFFVTSKIIRKIGTHKALAIAVCIKGTRSLILSWISNAWWIIPLSFFQGFTHALEWVAICSYFNLLTISTKGLQPATQGILQISQHGLGRACGSLIGGFFMKSYGSPMLFRVYGFLSYIVVALLGVFLWYNKKYLSHEGTSIDSDQPMHLLEENAGPNYLNPHGVPGTSVSRSPSPVPGMRRDHGSKSAAEIRTTPSPVPMHQTSSYGAMH